MTLSLNEDAAKACKQQLLTVSISTNRNIVNQRSTHPNNLSFDIYFLGSQIKAKFPSISGALTKKVRLFGYLVFATRFRPVPSKILQNPYLRQPNVRANPRLISRGVYDSQTHIFSPAPRAKEGSMLTFVSTSSPGHTFILMILDLFDVWLGGWKATVDSRAYLYKLVHFITILKTTSKADIKWWLIPRPILSPTCCRPKVRSSITILRINI